MKHPIPSEALDDRFGFLGTSGSGKTYNAGTAVELLLARRARVVIIDPLGVWWGLRLLGDGKKPSNFNIAIFGGPRGDLPLTEHAGALIGETAATMAESCILDLSELASKAADRRFMLAFLEAIYAKASGEPFHLIVDEADLFAPQKPQRPGDEMLLHHMEQIVRRGRIKGFIPWLISQRPAVLNKNVLSQVDGLLAFKLTGSQDRDALDAWIEGQADKAQGKAIKDALPTLKIGQGVVWLPSRGILEQAAFPPKVTFDSSRTPKRGEKATRTAKLKPLDVGKLKERLVTVEAEAKANDPRELRKEIAALKAERDKLAKGKASPDPDAIAKAEERGFEQAKTALRREAEKHAQNIIVDAMAALEALVAPIGVRLKEQLGAARKSRAALNIEFTPSQGSPAASHKPGIAPAPSPRPTASSAPHRPPPAAKPSAVASGDGAISNVQQRILDAIAEMQALCAVAPPRTLVAIIAGYGHPQSKGFANALSGLSSAGHITYPSGGTVALTSSGQSLAAAPSQALTTEEVQRRVVRQSKSVANKRRMTVSRTFGDAERAALRRRQVKAQLCADLCVSPSTARAGRASDPFDGP